MSNSSAILGRAKGAAAAGHEMVARVGIDVLEAGGNAVDSVVAMIAAGCVCESTLTSLGGGGFIIVGGGKHSMPPVLIDCFVRQPGFDSRADLAPWEVFELELDGTTLPFGTGPAAVAVPGIPRGLAHASRRFGLLPLANVLAPAEALAREGVPLTHTQATEHQMNSGLYARSQHGREIYLNAEGRARSEGELFCQPAMADVIAELAATGCESMYRGEIAAQLLAWSDARSARISRADLERYQVIERAPSQMCMGDVCMYTNPAPAMGGNITVKLLEQMRKAHDRRWHRDMRIGFALMQVMRQLHPPQTSAPEQGEEVARSREFAHSTSTTHVSAMDSDGLIAGATTSVGYGSGEFVPGCGIQLNNMLAEYDHLARREPGVTVPSMMTPAILTSPRMLVQIGSAGGERIPHAIAQILERMWEGMSLNDAIDAPRFGWKDDALHAEPGLDEGALNQLSDHVEVVSWHDRDSFFGTTNGTALRAGEAFSMGDSRRQGTGLIVACD